MKTHLIKIRWDDPYPKEKEYRIGASTITLAPTRALKQWRRDNPRKRLKSVSVIATTL